MTGSRFIYLLLLYLPEEHRFKNDMTYFKMFTAYIFFYDFHNGQALYFKSLNHVDRFCGRWAEKVVQLNSFAYKCTVSPNCLLKDRYSLALLSLVINWPYACRFIFGFSSSVPLICVFVFVLVPYCSDCLS